jgi:DNA-binding response OmpR family regulator
MREVVIRIRKVLDRYSNGDARPGAAEADRFYRFDDFILDAHRRELKSLAGDLITLTETEFRILELFVKRQRCIISRDEITHLLKGHQWSPYDRTIDGHVSRLRAKLNSAERDGSLIIKSVRGVGYVFVSDVESIKGHHTFRMI